MCGEELHSGALLHTPADPEVAAVARDAHLTALGYRVIRITWRRLSTRPGEVARILETLLR